MDKACKNLKKIPLFAQLDDLWIKRVASIARVHQAPKGTLVFQKHTAGNHLFIVLKGRIKIFSEMPGVGKRKTFDYLDRGDFFGEMSLVDCKGRSLSACALEDSQLLSISRADFQKLLKQQPEFTLLIIKTLIERLRRANEEIESLTFRSLFGRVCRKLLELSQKGTSKGEALVAQGITHTELADLTGTAREMVTKVLSSLRRLQIIQYENHHIKISKPEKLKELAQVES